MNRKMELLQELQRCVSEMEDELVIKVAETYLNEGYNAHEGIMQGLVAGMEKAGDLFEQGEYFVPELLICSDAMNNGLDVIKPHLAVEDIGETINVVIGVVEGDTHDIGKNLVKIMLETAGFDVHDLGRDVPAVDFVNKAKEIDARIICMSTLMTTTMSNMQRVIELLKAEGLYGKIKTMIGGAPISQSFADLIGADAYTSNAVEAAKRAKLLMSC
ncbi:MAG: cobalamin-binding protein [Syntrophomonadaceae bacterium]|nr:cobalamin-binding protein [Syntrophomonadaceae bacterium]